MEQKNSNNIREQIVNIRAAKGVSAFAKRDQVTRVIIQTLKQRGAFFQTERGGFYFNWSPATLYPLDYDSLPLSALIHQEFGLNRAERREYEHVLAALQHEAFLKGQHVEIHQLAHYDPKQRVLYVSRFDGQMHRLDGRSVESVANGTGGVFFWDDPHWEQYSFKPNPGGPKLLDSLLLKTMNLAPRNGLSADDQRWLMKVWMMAQFFGSLHPTKPLLLVCGPKGGGKTSALRKWLRLLFGGKGEVTALEHSKPDGFTAKVTSTPIAVFDNVDEHISWLPDHLAQLATGLSFSRRKLYTTNESVDYRPVCWVGLTSRTASFVERRDDVADRMIIVQTNRFDSYRPESALLGQVAFSRNALWSELLQTLNNFVAFLRTRSYEGSAVKFRMADFANFALKIGEWEGSGPKASEILDRMQRSQADLALREEPIQICLSEWLRKSENQGREVSSAELRQDLAGIASSLGLNWQYLSPRSLGQRLSNILNDLRQHFDVSDRKDSANQCWYQFRPKTESLNLTESPAEELQPA